MIDRGISEEYLVWWLENASSNVSYDLAEHAERQLRGARRLARHAGSRSIVDLYDFFRTRFGEPIAAEALRRALLGLAR